MEKARLSGQTILIVQDKLDSAIPLQDRIVGDGGRVLTAYSLARALLLAERAALSGAVIDLGMTGADQIVELLKNRDVPCIFDLKPAERYFDSGAELPLSKSTSLDSERHLSNDGR
jgi:hypothetical protein